MLKLIKVSFIVSLLCLVVITALNTPVRANATTTQTSKIIAGVPVAGALFGQSVAASGNTAVIGAPSEASGGDLNVGAAYVFTFNGAVWSQAARLTASDGAAGDLFGTAVAIDGGSIVVGARGDDDGGGNVGAAYVFTGGGSSWTEADKLIPSTNSDNAVGFAVAIDGDTIAISGPYKNSGTINSGAVYIFEVGGGGWTETQRLATSSGGAVLSDSFGWSIALSGDLLVVGAPLDDVVYTFSPQGTDWVETDSLSGNDTASGDDFGHAVATDGTRILVGAGDDSDAGNEAGSAFIFVSNGTDWVQEAKLVPTTPTPLNGSNFGRSVAIVGGTAVVGAPNSKGILDREEAGAVYVYQFNGIAWSVDLLTATDAATDDHLGTAVALFTAGILAGAPGNNQNETDAGAVYDFRLDVDVPPPPPSGDAQICQSEEQSVEEVLPGTVLIWDSALRCNNTPSQGQYAFTVTLTADNGNTAALTIDDIILTHTTPRPLGQAPDAVIDHVSGLPATLNGGASDSFMVSGTYELVTTGEGEKANLHFCAKGHDPATGEPFFLGINAFLRDNDTEDSGNNGDPPPNISNINVAPGPLSAFITWQTDQPATSSVSYYQIDQPGMQLSVTKGCLAVQNHEVEISGLLPGLDYEFQVQSQTGNGDPATSGMLSFSTTELAEQVYLPVAYR